jgi:hypothetical protein
MWKAIVAGTAALAIAGSSLVYAQQRFGRPEGGQRWRPNMEDLRAFGEARLAALKAGLVLNADQEKNWPAFEQAAREFAKLRLDRLGTEMAARRDGARREGGPGPAANDPAQRLRERGTVMADTGAALKKLGDATDPLYKSLDDSQKRRFALLARLGRGGEGGFRGREGGPGFRGREDEGPRGFFGPRRSDAEPRDFGRRRFERGPGGYGGFEGSGPADRERNPRRFERGDGGTLRGETL